VRKGFGEIRGDTSTSLFIQRANYLHDKNKEVWIKNMIQYFDKVDQQSNM
jgi:hypothetical protein